MTRRRDCVWILVRLIQPVRFSSNFVKQYIDEDAVISYAEDLFNQDVYDSPESYLDDSDRNLSKKQEEQIKILEDKIEKYRELVSKLEGSMDGEDDEDIEETK
mgnify:CR=1 FL=1